MVLGAFRRRLGGLRNRFRTNLRRLRRGQPSGISPPQSLLNEGLRYAIHYAEYLYIHALVAILWIKIKTGMVPAGPFPNVPLFLKVFMNRARRRYANQREILYIRTYMAVVAYYVDKAALLGKPNSFLEMKPILGTNIADPTYQLRMGTIAETLFLLRMSNGFGEFRKRLKTRNLRAAFYEAFAAREMLMAQYEIHARPETYVKGQDYDFFATKNAERVNVEVTTAEEKQFSEKTIPNKLRDKRKQLPDTAPAIIFIGLPSQWSIEPREWDKHFLKATANFFRGSKRITAVVFLREQIIIRQPALSS